MNVFVDASSGSPLRQYSDFITEVGAGTGTYGDNKKVSATPVAGAFVADDKLRPTEITTFDAKGNFARAQAIIGGVTPSIADIASSTSNSWTDGTVVDAHVYAGLYYDYLFKRFGRHGLDGRDLRIDLLTHPVRLADIATAPASVVGIVLPQRVLLALGRAQRPRFDGVWRGRPQGIPGAEPRGEGILGGVRRGRARAHARRDWQFGQSEWLSVERGRCPERRLLRYFWRIDDVLLPAGRLRSASSELPAGQRPDGAKRSFVAIAQQPCLNRRSRSLHPAYHRRRSALQFDDSQSRLLSGDRGRHQSHVRPRRARRGRRQSGADREGVLSSLDAPAAFECDLRPDARRHDTGGT